MEKSALQRAATLIAKVNVNPHVASVRVEWQSAESRLTVQYYVDGDPTDDERELCELTLTELLAEFPDVLTAETQCLPDTSKVGTLEDGIVYCRSVDDTCEG